METRRRYGRNSKRQSLELKSIDMIWRCLLVVSILFSAVNSCYLRMPIVTIIVSVLFFVSFGREILYSYDERISNPIDEIKSKKDLLPIPVGILLVGAFICLLVTIKFHLGILFWFACVYLLIRLSYGFVLKLNKQPEIINKVLRLKKTKCSPSDDETTIPEVKKMTRKEKITQKILSGDMSILENLISEYKETEKPEKLVSLFSNNTTLSEWADNNYDNPMVLSLPSEVWDAIDESLTPVATVETHLEDVEESGESPEWTKWIFVAVFIESILAIFLSGNLIPAATFNLLQIIVPCICGFFGNYRDGFRQQKVLWCLIIWLTGGNLLGIIAVVLTILMCTIAGKANSYNWELPSEDGQFVKFKPIIPTTGIVHPFRTYWFAKYGDTIQFYRKLTAFGKPSTDLAVVGNVDIVSSPLIALFGYSTVKVEIYKEGKNDVINIGCSKKMAEKLERYIQQYRDWTCARRGISRHRTS